MYLHASTISLLMALLQESHLRPDLGDGAGEHSFLQGFMGDGLRCGANPKIRVQELIVATSMRHDVQKRQDDVHGKRSATSCQIAIQR